LQDPPKFTPIGIFLVWKYTPIKVLSIFFNSVCRNGWNLFYNDFFASAYLLKSELIFFFFLMKWLAVHENAIEQIRQKKIVSNQNFDSTFLTAENLRVRTFSKSFSKFATVILMDGCCCLKIFWKENEIFQKAGMTQQKNGQKKENQFYVKKIFNNFLATSAWVRVCVCVCQHWKELCKSSDHFFPFFIFFEKNWQKIPDRYWSI
jgi:hypothetical protein